MPDGYTEGVSNTQRYKMLGNGWTVDVICHLFRALLSTEALVKTKKPTVQYELFTEEAIS